MASPAFGSAGTYLSGASSTTAAFAVPASVAANDVIIVTYYSEDTTGTVTAPGGFAVKTDTIVTGNHRLVIAWKRASGADTGTYSFTTTNAAWREGGAVRYTGVVTSGDPFDVTSTNQATSGTTTPAVSVTTTVADTLLVWAMSNFNGGTASAPSGYTLRLSGAGGDAAQATLAQASIGGSGSITATAPANAGQTAFLGALKPNASSFSGTPTDARGVTDSTTLARSSVLGDDGFRTDLAQAQLSLPRNFTEDRGWVDALALDLNHLLNPSEDRGTSDSIARDFGLNPVDNRGEVDTDSNIGVYSPALLENRGLADTPTASDIQGTQTDVRGLSDAVETIIIPPGANNTGIFPNDNRQISDTGFTRVISGATFDGRGITDDCLVTLAGNQNFPVTVTDSRGLTDTGKIYDRSGYQVDDTVRTDILDVNLIRDNFLTLDLFEDRGIDGDITRPATDNGTPKTTTLTDDRGIGDPTNGGGFIDIEQFLDEDRGLIDNLATFVQLDNLYTETPTDVTGLTDAGTVKGFDGQAVEDRGISDSILVVYAAAPQTIAVNLAENRGLADSLVLRAASLSLLDNVGWTDQLDASVGIFTFLDLLDDRGISDIDSPEITRPTLFFRTPIIKTRLYTRHGLWARTYLDQGITILRFGESFVPVQIPDTDQIETADAVYIGGRIYIVDFEEAIRLVNAGYGAWVTNDLEAPVDQTDLSLYGVGAYGTGPYGE